MKSSKLTTLVLVLLFGLSSLIAQAQTAKSGPLQKKILFVVTSHDQKGNTGEKTGYYLSEVAHPWKVLTQAGYEIDFVSPLGGNPPVDGFDLKDPENKEFWENKYYHDKLTHSFKPDEVKAADYAAIYYAGGHGAMWDLPANAAIAALAATIYEQQGLVAAVCHGPAGLVNIRFRDGSYLVAGKKLTGFSNEEEALVKLTAVVPFLLEDQLKTRGGLYGKAAPWQSHIVVDKRLITGQNPQSATAVGEALRDALK